MDKNNIYLFVLLILSLVVTVAVTSALMLVKKAKNQEFKERTLIMFQKEEDDSTYKNQYTIFQLRKTKIELESCLFENEVKTYCAYNYPDYNDDDEVAKASIDLLDELKIQPGDTTTINTKDIEQEIFVKYLSVFNVLTSPLGP